MRWRALFVISLVINIALGAIWMVSTRRQSEWLAAERAKINVPAQVKTNVVIRRQFFSWEEVESSDYSVYVANLRDIGCPEQTIRDIIIADVNTLYARRFATEVVTSDQQWWRSEPDPDIVRAALEKARELDDERRALLASLLGVDWESRDLAGLPRPTHPGVSLDGPVLGVLPEDVKQTLQNLSAMAQDRLQDYLDAQRQRGKAPDPVEMARLRQQTRDDLARLLSPQQLEEYLLRYSQNAKDLRAELGQLKYLNATPEEFRNVFRATDLIDQKLQMLAESNDPNSVAQRNALLLQRESAIKNALGPGRYEQYAQFHDPLYRAAFAVAQEADNPEAVQVLYQLKLAAAQQMSAIRANTNLTTQQREVELKRAELQQLQANALVLGQEVAVEAPPLPEPVVQAPPMRTRPYVLGIGESAASVARAYGFSMADMQVANPGVNLNRLKAGNTIRVPDNPSVN